MTSVLTFPPSPHSIALAIVSYPKKRTGVRPEDLQQQHTVVIRCDQCGDLVAGSADLREHVKNKHGQQAAQDAG